MEYMLIWNSYSQRGRQWSKLSFDKENVEESFMQTLESKVHAWLVDAVPNDVQTKGVRQSIH